MQVIVPHKLQPERSHKNPLLSGSGSLYTFILTPSNPFFLFLHLTVHTHARPLPPKPNLQQVLLHSYHVHVPTKPSHKEPKNKPTTGFKSSEDHFSKSLLSFSLSHSLSPNPTQPNNNNNNKIRHLSLSLLSHVIYEGLNRSLFFVFLTWFLRLE